ncbi:hypothetical protein [Moorena sp. SIO4G3]|uniref:hypothetical protein n=1 Tax=Moorena sp. SIO4G3 TaxID=2607821 RepID=UPI00142A40CA|nr:hypothetical protein [Moorena sp. SIO4G3]NEO77332.1 hypothetical protein [Moorena sp. SIO4G3]
MRDDCNTFVERAFCCGMGIRRGTGILPVSFPGRQDAHPTHIHRKIQQWPFSRLAFYVYKVPI